MGSITRHVPGEFRSKLREVALSLAIYAVGSVAALLVQYFLAGVMGANEYGLFSYAFSWIAIIAIIPRFGLDMSAIRYLSEYKTKEHWALFWGFFRRSYNFVVLLALIVVLSLALLITFDLAWPETGELVLVGCLGIPFLALLRLNQAALQAVGRSKYSFLGNVFLLPASLLCLSYAASLYVQMTAEVVIWLQCCAALFTYVLMSIYLQASLQGLPQPARVDHRDKLWLVASLPFFVASGLNILLGRIDVIMVGGLLGPRDAGIYAICSIIASVISFGLVAVNMFLGPMVSSLFHTNQLDRLQSHIAGYMRVCLLITTPLFLIVMLFGGAALRFIGTEYTDGHLCLILLCAGQILNVLLGSVGMVMNMTGYQTSAAKIMLLALAVNITLNLILIPLLGIEGAAIATVTALATWNWIMYRYIKTSLKIETSVLSILRTSSA